jgi:SAM-dependent methyltransferase
MDHPDVGQAALLSRILGDAVRAHTPRSAAVLGCAGGNGFEKLIDSSVERVVGIDISPEFIEAVRDRFGHRFSNLQLACGNVETDAFDFEPVALVYAGLLFEYVDIRKALSNIRYMLEEHGILTTVLQLASPIAEITPSPYASEFTALASVMNLVEPHVFSETARQRGYVPISSELAEAGGKKFRIMEFRAT